MPAVQRRDQQRVVAEIAVVRLVVVGGTLVLGPKLDLVNFEVVGAEEPLRRIDQVGMHREPVERPVRVGEQRQTRELAGREMFESFRTREVVGRGRVDVPHRLLRAGEFLAVDEVWHDREALLVEFP